MPAPIILIVPVLLMAGLLHIVPQFTRPGLFFAVTVPTEFRRSNEGRRIVTRYRLIVWSSSLVAVAALLSTGQPLLTVLILGAGCLWAFVSSRQKALAYAVAPDTTIEVELGAPLEHLPGGPIVALLPVAFLAALCVWAIGHLDRLPDRIVVHWGFEGADRWVPTTPATVFGFLAVHAALCLLLVGVAWGILQASRRISTSGPAAGSERAFRRRLMQMLIVTGYLLVGPAVFGLLMPEAPGMTIWGLVLAAAVVVFSVSLVRFGQGGVRAVASATGAPSGDRTSDACWKWGMIYVNPADPAILVEKRFGIGYTVNLGNRWSWVAFGALLAPAALALIFLH